MAATAEMARLLPEVTQRLELVEAPELVVEAEAAAAEVGAVALLPTEVVAAMAAQGLAVQTALSL